MKRAFTILFFLIIGFAAQSQSDSIRGQQFQLKGKIVGKIELTPHCGVVAWGTVIEFEVTELIGMNYPKKKIGVIITCPEFYEGNFFEAGKTYQVVFSDKNQADFSWTIPNKDLLKKNSLPFDPYVVKIRKIS